MPHDGIKSLARLTAILSAVILMWVQPAIPAQAQTLKVSDNNRYLITDDGTPFFWLGDTAWELFHRLNREEATQYLENRAEKGFTVIQAVVLAELDGLTTPNPHQKLIAKDSLRNIAPARAAKARDNSFAIIYIPHGQDLNVELSMFDNSIIKAAWYNPPMRKASA